MHREQEVVGLIVGLNGSDQTFNSAGARRSAGGGGLQLSAKIGLKLAERS